MGRKSRLREEDDEYPGYMDEFGDWRLRLCRDDQGRSAWDVAKTGPSQEEMERAVQLGNVMFMFRYTWSLTEAANSGDLDSVKRLLDAGAGIHNREKYASLVGAPIEEAARKGYFEVAKAILEAERTKMEKDGYSLERLQQAVKEEQHEEVARQNEAKSFLEAGQRHKNRALQGAAGIGRLDIAKLLVEHGAEHDAKPDFEHTYALSGAAAGGHVEMVEYLLSLGTSVNPDGRSAMKAPLTAAAEGGSIEIVDKILQAGAQIDTRGVEVLRTASNSGNVEIVKRLLEAGAAVNVGHALEHEETTPLQEAAGKGHVDVLKVLLDAAADVNVAAPRSGRTALQAAAGSGSVQAVKVLMDAGAEVNAPAGEYGRTALQAASEIGDLEIVEILLGAGAKLEEKALDWASPALMLAIKGGHDAVIERLLQQMTQCMDEEKLELSRRALSEAVKTGNLKVVKRLLELGTPVVDRNRSQIGVVLEAAQKGYTDMIRLLFDAGVESDFNGHYGVGTAVQCAVKGRHIETVRFLVSTGADVNATHGREKPSLYLAAKNADVDMVKFLLEQCADVHAKSYQGKTVLHAAEKGGNAEILQLVAEKRLENPEQPAEDGPLDVATVKSGDLCSACQQLPFEFFSNTRWRSGMIDSHILYPSLTELQRSARNGCPFCMFLWKQLRITTVSIPQPSKVKLYNSGRCFSLEPSPDDVQWSVRIEEPYPDDVECPKQVYADLRACVAPFEGKRKPPPGNTASEDTFHQVKSWLSECTDSHPTCAMKINPDFLPTWLIDISGWAESKTIKLIETKNLPLTTSPYIALSHAFATKAISSALTILVNVASRLEDIPANTLPLTFLHAVEVTHQLGMDYLWINAVCIIQDSKKDRDREMSMITKIYSSAYCTISANISEETEGLFREIDTCSESVVFPCKSAAGSVEQVRAMKFQPSWQDLYKSGPLHKQAWAMQERETSPRVVHYTATQVLWECRIGCASEGFPTIKRPAGGMKQDTHSMRLLDWLEWEPGLSIIQRV